MDKLTAIALKQRFVRKEILYWEVYQNNQLIDHNNSIKLLRHKYPGKNYVFKSVR